MDALPPHLKLKILNLDPKLMSAAYGEKENGTKATGHTSEYPKLTLHHSSNLNKFTSTLLQSLSTDGYIILDNFLGRGALLKCKADGVAMHEIGELRPARMNKGDDQWKQQDVRGDAIKWLDRADFEMRAKYISIWALLDSIDSLRAELDSTCDFHSTKSQVQIARYPSGTRYVRHRDAFIGSSEPTRRLTAIYYMNESWKQEDGGCLRMYLGEGTKDVEPIGDRLLVFWSAHVDHEVLLSNAERYACTMWFY